MPGPKPKFPSPDLNPIIVDMLDTLAYSVVKLHGRIRAGEISPEQAYQLCERAVDVMLEAVGAKLPRQGAGRPASLDNVLRRLAIRRTAERGSSLSQAFEVIGDTDFVVRDGNVEEVHPAPGAEAVAKHYYRDRRRYAAEDAYMAGYEAALRRYAEEMA
jgi:hypothetical protein